MHYCWGEGPDVERIDLGARIVRIAVGPDKVCAKTEHRDLYCWSSGGGGALAHPTPPSRAALVAEGVDEVDVVRHTLRFEPGGAFVAQTTCKDPRYDEKTTGRWERTGTTVRADEGAGARTYAAKWTLEIRGTELAGQRAVQRSDWPVQTVRGALAP